MNQQVCYSYKRINVFIERLNAFKIDNFKYFKCSKCTKECDYIISNVYCDHNFCNECVSKEKCQSCECKFKSCVKYWKLLNDEQYNKMIEDFKIINIGYIKYILNNETLRTDFLNMRFIIAMLLIHNKFATLEECCNMNMFLKSQNKVDYQKKIWSIMSVDLV
jgi:hypothetical protein